MINTIIILFSCARQSTMETPKTGELYSNVRYEAGPSTVAVEVTESADNTPEMRDENDDEAYQALHIYQRAP